MIRTKGVLLRTEKEIENHLQAIRRAAATVQTWFMSQTGDPLAFLRRMKFEEVGWHPIDGHPLNLIEQINQTWTYLAALAATRRLLAWHPDVGGFRLAPGAAAIQDLDVMSDTEGAVGAETFAAVDPRNNQKLVTDLNKMALRSERYRYVFFISPLYPGTKRLAQLERDNVQVWSVDVD
jgi:hypothetical protein